MGEIKGVVIEGVKVSTIEAERKKVIFRDCDGDNFYALLTNEQIDLLDYLKKNGLLEYHAKWEILLDEAWEKV
jgi:hypothetical protein